MNKLQIHSKSSDEKKKDAFLLHLAQHLILESGFMNDIELYHGKMG
jgi:hypothetical protein